METEVDGVFGEVDEEEGEHASPGKGLVLVRDWSFVMLRIGGGKGGEGGKGRVLELEAW